MACRPGPSFRALLFGCGGGAVLGQTAAFLVGSGGDVRQVGAVARRPRPSLRALLFRCGERALCEPWRLEDRSWRPWPAGPVRPSRPCCFGMAIAPCVSFGGWKTGQTASFLVGSESNVRQWGPWPAGPVRPSGPCCFGVASAPCLSLGGWKTAKRVSFLVGAESDVRH